MENLEFKDNGSHEFKIMSNLFESTGFIPQLPRQKRYGTPVAVRTEPKINRNAPCPCGSGKKFKKCCLTQCPQS